MRCYDSRSFVSQGTCLNQQLPRPLRGVITAMVTPLDEQLGLDPVSYTHLDVYKRQSHRLAAHNVAQTFEHVELRIVLLS